MTRVELYVLQGGVQIVCLLDGLGRDETTRAPHQQDRHRNLGRLAARVRQKYERLPVRWVVVGAGVSTPPRESHLPDETAEHHVARANQRVPP
jgi:hypothetical protein